MSEEGTAWLTVAEVAAEVKVTRGCVENWIKSGVLIQGQRVRLAATRIGSRYRLTREGLAAFIAGCNPNPVPAPETAAERQRRIDADREAFNRLAYPNRDPHTGQSRGRAKKPGA